MIQITDRTRSLDAFKLQEVEELLNKLFKRVSRLRQISGADLIVEGVRSSAGKTHSYAVTLLVKFSQGVSMRVEAAEGKIRPTVREAVNRVRKLLRRSKHD